MDGNVVSREALLRLALLRQCRGEVAPLHALLARHGSLVAAQGEARVRALLDEACAGTAAGVRLQAQDAAFLADDLAWALADTDAAWPPLLAEIAAAPRLLAGRGDVRLLARPQLAIVGSRHASPAGLALARSFAAELAAAGLVITSGMARGIDAAAHEGALAAGGQTVAVLGCGADRAYPPRNTALMQRIVAQGCVLSELLPGTAPLPHHFPQRNRIISGLVLGVLVVEAAPDSGSLITARLAAEQGRDVFAVPGSVHSPLARGCHQLIREGATLVEDCAQLLDALLHFARPAPVQQALPLAADAIDASARRWLDLLSPAGSSIDDVVAGSGRPAAEVVVALQELALRGLAWPLPGGRWQPAA